MKTLLKRSNHTEQMMVVVSCAWIFSLSLFTYSSASKPAITTVLLMFKSLMLALIISKHFCMSPNICSDAKLCKTGSLQLLNVFVL